VGTPAGRIKDMTAHGGTVTVGFPQVLIGNMPASRIGDMHMCPMVTPGTPPVPHVGGPFVTGAWTVWVGGAPQSKVGDTLICVGPPDSLALGEFTVLVGTAGGGAGFGAILAGLMAGLGNFLGGYPRAELDSHGNIVTQYNSQITIQGSPEYQAVVCADLDRFLRTRAGRCWAERYARTGRHTTIGPIPTGEPQDNGGESASSVSLVQLNPDGTERPGSGSDATIDYNPSYTGYYRGEDGNIYEAEPYQTLGHEMIHSLHSGNGEDRGNIDDIYPNGDNQEEARTIGVHGFDSEEPSERQLTEELHGPGSARPDHDSRSRSVYQDQYGAWHERNYDSDGRVASDTFLPVPPDGAPNH
jgi:uncharacterized Zn-binding protein involved in type VI secretion